MVFALAACERAPLIPPRPVGPPGASFTPVAFDRLVGWRDDGQAVALAAFRRSCAVVAKLPGERDMGAGGIAGRVADWQPVCAAASRVASGDASARAFFEARFAAYRVMDGGNDEGLFTGYFEPELKGARKSGGRFRYPLYARPKDLPSDGTTPYLSRAEIDKGALRGKGLELLWVDDPVDAFFLHVQGSGRVVLDDGQVVRAGFAGHNNRPYTALGRVLLDRGLLPKDGVSMQSIRAWLAANPDKATATMAENARYVFFRLSEGDGPIGSQGVALIPGRSLAVDRSVMPLGAPVWLDATDPLDRSKPLRRLLVAQDTGTAIRGVVRGDVFWGPGPEAADRAGRMQERGRYYVLLPKGVDPTLARPRS